MAECEICGKTMKAKSIKKHIENIHAEEHQSSAEQSEISYIAEEALFQAPPMGGENGRLRVLRRADPKWNDVYNSYNKVSEYANTPAERRELRKKIWQQRYTGNGGW